MLPAQISASPAYMTVSVCPSDDKPAVKAKGTVRPSAKPSVKSARKRERLGALTPAQGHAKVPRRAFLCAGWRISF